MYPRVRFEDLPPIDPVKLVHYKAGPECARGGCHRLARKYVANSPSPSFMPWNGWHLCEPCANAIWETR